MIESSRPMDPTRGLELLKGLTPDHAERLLEQAQFQSHRHHEVVVDAGEAADSFFLVISGCYKLLKPGPAQTQTLLSFATANEPIGFLMMATEQSRYPVTIEALGPSSLFRIPRQTYLKHWLTDPTMMQKMHLAVMKRCHGFHSDRSLQHLALPGRIAGFLLRCLELHPSENGNVLKYPLTRKEIAEAVGSHTESVIRVISAWQKKGWLTTSDRSLEITRPDRLAEFLKKTDAP
ncbi:MAG: Crp/Fnr family transcriptional regulator [Bdellovibrionaceae bacterium]|nr:Crp/Fnr family transcriptional regulator [Pseudobdellovibrionaceae bacterium]